MLPVKSDIFFQIMRQMRSHPAYTINLIRKKIRLQKRYRWIAQNKGRDNCVPPPLVLKAELTRLCNLRCKSCFQWGENGWCAQENPGSDFAELSWDVAENIILLADKHCSDIILTGGEPLLYSHFKKLCELIKARKCYTDICTNGTLIEKHIESFAENKFISLVVSVDGIQDINDMIRGSGVYEKVIKGIKALKKLERPPYIGIQHTIRPENVAHIHTFCKEMTILGVDWILLNPQWFLTCAESAEYESFISKTYNFKPIRHKGFISGYPLDTNTFAEQFSKIRNEHWPIQISCYLEHPEDIYGYVNDAAKLVSNRQCLKQWIRAEISPLGEVGPCIQFPDLIFGNLQNESLMDIWNNKLFEEFRKRARNQNHPLCGKCNNIYLYDSKRTHL